MVSRRLRGQPVAVWRLRYRVRGWNHPSLDPVRDLEWALAEVRHRHPGARVYLVGHSMGGRTVLRCVGDPSVVAVCALAPWLEPDEAVTQAAGRILRIAHGDRDRVTDPRRSRAYADQASLAGADVQFQPMLGDGHAMLRHAAHWNQFVRDFVAGVSGVRTAD